MTWSSAQIKTAAIAARAAGLSEPARKLILRQLPNAMYSPGGLKSTEPSSRSPRLTQTDFEVYMSTCEGHAGGQIPGYPTSHWAAKANDEFRRMQRLCEQLGAALCAMGVTGWGDPSSALQGWIKARVNPHKTELKTLDYGELHALINGLRAVKIRKEKAGCGGQHQI